MLEKVTYKDIFKFAWSYWKRRKKLGLLALFFFTLSTLVDVVFPTYVGALVDSFSGSFSQNRDSALHSMKIVLSLSIAFFVTRWIGARLYNYYECFSMCNILIDALEKVQRFSTNWHSNNFAGATVRKITRAKTAFEVFEDTIIFGFWQPAIILFGISAMLIMQLPIVGWYVFLTATFYCVFSVIITVKMLSPRYRKATMADTKMGAVIADIVSCNPTVKAFGTEKSEDALFYDSAEGWRRKQLRSYLLANDMDMVRSMITFVMLAGMLGLSFWYWQEGKATAGDLTMIITSFFMINGYLREIGRHVEHLQRAVSEMEDVVFFWKTAIAVKDKHDAKILRALKGEISFDSISFSYGNQETPIYQDFSIDIASGEKIALVGHSGSGKSTFVKLLQRLYDVQGGEIRIDGQNIADVTQNSLRRAIALVPQDPILFHRTLRENIAYARQDASEEEVIEAAKRAYAHEFIEGLPQGYDTMVGERGVKLSGGERQRVAIARAILSDASILILDEATSSLDSLSEDYIQKALKELMKGRTTITIAHRLSTIKDVDRILVFDQGRIVEQGVHEELLKNKKSLYKELYDVQVMGFIDG